MMKKKHNHFALALGLNLTFFLLCLGIGGIHLGSLDDYFMALVVTGAYGGEFDPHTLFLNGAYAYFLRPFYWLCPAVSWYFVFELFGVFASFTVFTYFMLRQVGGKLGVALSCFLLACLVPDFYLQLGFTQCAAAATAAAILLFYFGNSLRKPLWVVWGIVFFVVGIVFRKEGFLLGMPFLAAVLALSAFDCRKVLKMTIIALLVSIAAYQALQSFNSSLFEKGEYPYYREYQWKRAVLGDGAFFDKEASFDELEERGMRGRDFRFLRNWIFYDTEVFSLDSLRPIVNVVQRNRYEVNRARMPAALFLVLAKSFFKANAWCWAVLCLVFFFLIPRRANLYTWVSLALMCLCLGYLLYVNRVVYHVESGIWLYAIVSAIPLMRSDDFVRGYHIAKLPYLVGLMAFGSLVLALSSQGEANKNRAFFGVPQMPDDWTEFVGYVQAHPDDVFLLYFNSYKHLATFRHPPYMAAAPGSWANIIPVGYWNINLPGMKREMEKRGISNPLGSLVKSNVYILKEGIEPNFDEYYRAHYHMNVEIDSSMHFGELKLMKYRIAEVP